ncbi:MAG: hypothetical protein ACO3IC_07970 [Burkholderiaceae bacterium]
MKLGSETGSVINHLYSRMTEGEPEPTVGMGATLLSWTDRNPATIVQVNMAKRYIVVQEDDAMRVDSNGMSEAQEYVFTPNPNNRLRIYRKVKSGEWVEHYVNPETNRLVQTRGCGLRIGERDKYYDFSF